MSVNRWLLLPIGIIAFFVIAELFAFYMSLRPTFPPPTPHYAVRYSVTGIAMEVPESYGHLAINQSGDIVGAVKTSKVQKDCCGASYPVLHAALWHQGSVQDLGSLGPDESEPTGVNSQGQVIGIYSSAKGDWRGFLSTHGKMQDIGTLGGQGCTPRAINASGQIVGSADIARKTFNENGPGNVITRAFSWQSGQITDLTAQAGDIGGEEASNAESVNDAGVIVGNVDTNGTLWDHGHVEHPNMDYINAVNAAGHYAGNGPEGMVFAANGKSTKIDIAEGYSDGLSVEWASDVKALNTADQVVGKMFWTPGRAQAEGGEAWRKSVGFVWQDGKAFDLNSLIPANSGWELEDAQSINDAGWIVGAGKYYGKEHVFLLKPL